LFYIDPKVASESDVTSAHSLSTASAAVSWLQSTSISDQNDDSPDYLEALQEVLQGWKSPSNHQQAMAFLFLSPAWADDLKEICCTAQSMLGDTELTQLVTVVGGGIVGGGQEVEDPARHSMSFFGGFLPANSTVDIERIFNNEDEVCASDASKDHVNSYLVFADPYSTKVESVLQHCNKETTSIPSITSPPACGSGNIVAGAVTVAAHKQQSTLAVGNRVLTPGALIRISFSGNLGVQVVVSQGCRPVGPTYRVTKINGPAILELDAMRAIDELQTTIDRDCTSEDKDYIQTKGMSRGILGGFYKEADSLEDAHREDSLDKSFQMKSEPEDFIIRQMTGFLPKSGGIILCGRPTVKEGDFFRFHVRSPSSALEDWRKILKRAKTERLFLGSQAGEPIGALQFSCAARGEALFEKPNVDLHHVQELVRASVDGELQRYDDYDDRANSCHSPPVAGLFANAEISSLGNSIRMGASLDSLGTNQKSFLLGYATVVAMLCDYSEIQKHSRESGPYPSSTEASEIEVLGIMNPNSTDVWA
jgi:small ligand-binding sensory domain FIST